MYISIQVFVVSRYLFEKECYNQEGPFSSYIDIKNYMRKHFSGSITGINKDQLHVKEGNVLFNNALNTFYLHIYGVGHMVKDQSEREET